MPGTRCSPAMTKKGYTKSSCWTRDWSVQGKNGGLYDKFRNRLILPVIDVRGDVVAFGGRVAGQVRAKIHELARDTGVLQAPRCCTD
ncbi:MAG: hypothetical protein ACLT1A_00205 [Dysosmobacter sp.]